MILSFKKQFIDPIIQQTKIHTIREDKPNRWKAGNLIHFATGVRTKNYRCFATRECKSVQSIEIKYDDLGYISILIDDKEKTLSEISKLAKNDGFKTIEDFFDWFNTDFKGKIIHWSDFKY